jgi:hypothetical protein
MARNILNREDLAKARFHFFNACACSIAHDKAAALALTQYGDHGPNIAGCVRDHFPADVKDHLRGLARDVTLHSDAAYAARPKRVRMSTMRALSRACAQDGGSGFYGPQP